jgi:hypothetical protein
MVLGIDRCYQNFLLPILLNININLSCATLRRLHIRLCELHFIENLVERLPNLEEMSVECHWRSGLDPLRELNLRTLRKSNENWFNKVNEIRFYFC